jgi:hypothetical protein
MQNEKHSLEEFGRYFPSLWDTVEALGGLPGVNKGMVDAILLDPKRVVDGKILTQAETNKVHTDV